MYVNQAQKVMIASRLNTLADIASLRDIDVTLGVTVQLLGILGISEDDVPIIAELRKL